MSQENLIHCCAEMKAHLESGDLHLHYNPKFREYGIGYADDGISVQLLSFCPWCGSSLPVSLREKWFDELESLGIDPFGDSEIPAIMRSI